MFKYLLCVVLGFLLCVGLNYAVEGELPLASLKQKAETAVAEMKGAAAETLGETSDTPEPDNTKATSGSQQAPANAPPSPQTQPVAEPSPPAATGLSAEPSLPIAAVAKTTAPKAPKASTTANPPRPAAASSTANQHEELIRRTYTAVRARNILEANKLVKELGQKRGSQRVAAAHRMTSIAMQFWNTVALSVNSMGAGSIIGEGNNVAAYVDHSRDVLVLRIAGQNKRYNIRDLPAGIVVAIAKRKLKPENPNHALMLGAFVGIDKDGDKNRAMEYFQSARGVKVDDLIAELGRIGGDNTVGSKKSGNTRPIRVPTQTKSKVFPTQP